MPLLQLLLSWGPAPACEELLDVCTGTAVSLQFLLRSVLTHLPGQRSPRPLLCQGNVASSSSVLVYESQKKADNSSS